MTASNRWLSQKRQRCFKMDYTTNALVVKPKYLVKQPRKVDFIPCLCYTSCEKIHPYKGVACWPQGIQDIGTHEVMGQGSSIA